MFVLPMSLPRSKKLFPLILIYGFGPPHAEGLQMHEVKTLVWETDIFKAYTHKKRKKLTGIIYVLTFFA